MFPQTPKTRKPPSEAPPLQRARRNRSYIGHQHHLLNLGLGLDLDRITCRLDFEAAHISNDEYNSELEYFSTN